MRYYVRIFATNAAGRGDHSNVVDNGPRLGSLWPKASPAAGGGSVTLSGARLGARV